MDDSAHPGSRSPDHLALAGERGEPHGEDLRVVVLEGDGGQVLEQEFVEDLWWGVVEGHGFARQGGLVV
jgi:hypothetical protein